MKPVYLAGPIFGCDDGMASGWRRQVTTMLPAVLDPMSRDYRGQEGGNEAEIVRGDLADILACRAVLVMAITPSWGTAMELVYAKLLGVPVIAVVANPAKCSPWLVVHSTARVQSLEEAVEWLNRECA